MPEWAHYALLGRKSTKNFVLGGHFYWKIILFGIVFNKGPLAVIARIQTKKRQLALFLINKSLKPYS